MGLYGSKPQRDSFRCTAPGKSLWVQEMNEGKARPPPQELPLFRL